MQLRPWQTEDEETLIRLANNRKVWRNLTNRFPHPYRHQDAVEWIAAANSDPDNGINLAILVEAEVVGGVGFRRGDDLGTRTAEIGYWLGEPHWGRGIATEALLQASRIAFSEFDFVRLEASVLDWNPASRRVLEKAGYSLEARRRQRIFKDGVICDDWLYSLLRHP